MFALACAMQQLIVIFFVCFPQHWSAAARLGPANPNKCNSLPAPFSSSSAFFFCSPQYRSTSAVHARRSG